MSTVAFTASLQEVLARGSREVSPFFLWDDQERIFTLISLAFRAGAKGSTITVTTALVIGNTVLTQDYSGGLSNHQDVFCGMFYLNILIKVGIFHQQASV